ncbi:MAG: response regulator [Candidatus Omnitrophica bacterium]|nr:response regulator [Candidatus Omnitrophota bacterium]
MSKKILVVDNEPRIVELLSKILSREGMTVLSTMNGEDCLKLAIENMPDLIILDLLMPGMDGGTVATTLEENPKTKDIPVIFLSGAISEREVAERGGKVGGREFLAKGSDIGDLVKAIKKTVGA